MRYFFALLLLSVLVTLMGLPVYAQNNLLILNKSGNSAWQLDAATGEKIAEYATDAAPHEVAISPDDATASITNYGDSKAGNTVTLIDIENREKIKTISLNNYERPHGIEWFSDGRHLAVSNARSSTINVFNALSKKS